MDFTKPFQKIGKADVAIAGGKGASLGEMTQAGIPVPPGFVVLSTAFEEFIKESGLNIEIDTILHSVDTKKIHTVENAAEKIQGLILNSDINNELKKKILDEFEKLNSKYVAVRSSATAEDSASAAWAGQLDTFLNTSKNNLIENVKKCWASLFTPRAIFYRFEKNLHKEKISVAVVVQKMVESETSGIAFSVHPVTQDYNQLIIEAGFGLGEAIVSGSITPDNYVVEKKDWFLLNKSVNEQERGLFRKEGDGSEWKELGDQGNKQVLSDKDIILLSKLIVKIEEHYDFPVDVEWAEEKGKFYITQSRPITTLSKIKQKEETLVEKFKIEMGNEELLVVRGKFIPLFLMTDWLKFYDGQFKEKEGIYPVLSIKKGDIFTHYISLDRYLGISRKAIERYIKNPKFKHDIQERYNKIKEKINTLYENYFKNKELAEKELLKLLKTSEDYLHELVALTLFIDFLDSKIVKETYKDKGHKLNFEKIFKVSEICDFPSFDLKNNIEISNNQKSTEILKHIYTGYSAAPTKEEVEHKISKINIDELKKEIKLSKEEINKKAEKKKQLKKDLNKEEKLVEDFLSWITELRDDRKPLMNKIDVLFNECVRTLYREWGIEKELSSVSYASEVKKGKEFSLKNLNNVKRRQKDFINLYYGDEEYTEKYENLKSELREAETLEKPRSDAKTVIGQIANKGNTKGIARIIYDPKQFHSFSEGDILITSMTRPEFVPLMKKASAIVTNEGGIACHAAIVSREIDKPCIIGTKNATEIIRDGDLVDVDANNGVVKIIENKEKKEYTELVHLDLPLSLVELHYEQEASESAPWANEKFPIKPYIVYERKNGLVHLFYDKKGINWQMENAGKYKDEKSAINNIKTKYNLIKSIIEEERALDKKEFIEFIENLRDLWPWINYMWWAIEQKEKNKESFTELIKIRKYTEHFTPGINAVFKKSIEKIFPKEKDYVNVLSLKEIETEKFPSENTLKKRLKSYSYTDYNLYSTTEEILNKHNIKIEETIDDTNELHGQSAYPGNARGKVRIIKKREDVTKIKEGEILVASTTTPDFLPAMKKSSAILSEHGGAISHAAITSRELKIPCVVGIKGATKVLKDGDTVEIDAGKGTIKLIKD